MHIDRIVLAEIFLVPDGLVDIVSGKYLPGIADQQLEDPVFALCERDLLSRHGDAKFIQPHHNVLVHQPFVSAPVSFPLPFPAQYRLDPRQQLLRVKRLHHIVIRPCAQQLHPGAHIVPRRGDDHHDPRVDLPDARQQLLPCHTRQHQIEHHRCRCISFYI